MLTFGSLYKVTWDEGVNLFSAKPELEKRWNEKIEYVDWNLVDRVAWLATDDEKGDHATKFRDMVDKKHWSDRFDNWDLGDWLDVKGMAGAVVAALGEKVRFVRVKMGKTDDIHLVKDDESFLVEKR